MFINRSKNDFSVLLGQFVQFKNGIVNGTAKKVNGSEKLVS